MTCKNFLIILLLVSLSKVESASYYEMTYDYVRSIAPTVMSIFDCLSEEDAWACAKSKAATILDSWTEEIKKQRDIWKAEADEEVSSSGRSIGEPPSKLAGEIEDSLNSVAVLVQHGMARALSKKHGGGGIDSITISAANEGHKKMKKKKQKPPKIHLIQPVVMKMHKKNKMPEKGRAFEAGRLQSWVIGHEEVRNLDSSSHNDRDDSENSTSRVSIRKGRGYMEDVWSLGHKALDDLAEYAIESDDKENGIADKSTLAEQRGKKKKKKKAILKLLILGAVLKAKIGTLLQILSFKLQVKFFIIALIGLGINLARFWVDLKKQNAQPQKVIYYEHAQHQHHYEHEDEPGWGPWSRSMDPPEETDAELEIDVNNSPYRGQDRVAPNLSFLRA